MRDIPIVQVMTPDPATVSPQSSVAEARRLLNSNVINHLPVVEGGRLVGIVSSSDFLKLHLLDGMLQIVSDATVNQIMETNVIVVNKNATLGDAAEKLSVGGFHALPVIDRKRRLVGMVTSSDLIGVLVSTLDN
ncbi:MAG: CBS domain-containing protein [Gammaproteobacteria bacterium]|jgi:CBS domain-containing protein|nr:CBS domain-containing protein [Gammaproteobacteria bacterium]MDH3779194.1 CBS domain-containing protein [Gammaproteobacteria bacterium]MDH3861135.1 CBS domain-containing protein [Gammaproteobacteria bacterium]